MALAFSMGPRYRVERGATEEADQAKLALQLVVVSELRAIVECDRTPSGFGQISRWRGEFGGDGLGSPWCTPDSGAACEAEPCAGSYSDRPPQG
jgi:hypothetical protein